VKTPELPEFFKTFRISKPLKSYHLHNEHQATEKVITDLKNGQNIAIITDAGTPGISDPGYLLAKAGQIIILK
jgi:16S rRNA (cytidine1402-2'-O)-methyltransferase